MGISDLVSSSDAAAENGLTSDGRRDAIVRHCEIDAVEPTIKVRQRNALGDVLEAVMFRGEVTDADLLAYQPTHDDVHVPEQLRFGTWAGEEWLEQFVAMNLEALPCVDRRGDTWVYTGIDADAYDDEDIRPLEEIRADPETRLAQTLDDLGLDRTDDDRRRELIRSFHTRLRGEGALLEGELDATTHRGSLSDVESTMLDLPGVGRDETPPEPSEISIETYQDVLDARDAVNQGPEVTWTYETE